MSTSPEPSHPGVLAELRPAARFLSLARPAAVSPHDIVAALAELRTGPDLLVALGPRLLADLGVRVHGLEPFPDLAAEGSTVAVPTTPLDLWIRVMGDDPGEALHRGRAVRAALPPALEVLDATDGFVHRGGRDLTGYEDGTENPDADTAPSVALATGRGPGFDGGSVVAVQRWVHDLPAFHAMDRTAQDHAIGRARDSNEELEDAPPSAHVQRTAQEDFDPEAFVWRRSMPWSDPRGAGLVFVAFAGSAAPFLAQMRRMVGLDDGIVDALFRFSRPVTGALAWCPPTRAGRLDLRALSAP